MFCVYEERVACCSCSPYQFPISFKIRSFSISVYLYFPLNDVKEGQKRISALVIQQYDLENMGKKLGSFCFVFSSKNKTNKILSCCPRWAVRQLRQQRRIFTSFIVLLSSDNLGSISKITVSFYQQLILSPSFIQEMKTMSSKLSFQKTGN